MKFRYSGGLQARQIKGEGKVVFDGNFVSGQIYDLPETNEEVKILIALGLFKPVHEEPQKQTLPAVTKKKESTK